MCVATACRPSSVPKEAFTDPLCVVRTCNRYSSGQNKVNVHPACNDRAMVIALKRNAKRTEDGNAFLTDLFFIGFVFTSLVQFHTCVFHSVRHSKGKGNSQVPNPLSSLAKRIQRLSGSTGVTFDGPLIMHKNLPR